MKYTDKYFMNIALNLAKQAIALTSPNPMVGALVVKNNKIIGKGYHRRAGGSHAEVFALEEAGKISKGAKLYVTLEPCRHFGRTPPCIDRILDSGVKEVIIGMKDPNPLNDGKSIEQLRRQGIRVKVGVLEEELKKLNEVFIKYITKKIPFITIKIAESLDGKIATYLRDSQWITQGKTRNYSHKLRKLYDAILVGVNTVLKDNPLLNPGIKKRFFKIIIDPELKTPKTARIFSKKSMGKVLIVTSNKASKNKKMILEKNGAKVFIFVPKKSSIPLKKMLRQMAELEISNILVEGGGETIGRFFDEGLVDRVLFFIAPKIIGGRDAISSVMGEGVAKVSQAIKLKNLEIKRIGPDLLVESSVCRNN